MISPSSTDRRHSLNPCSLTTNTPFIRVFLLRQIMVSVFGQRAWRTCVIGEGNLRPLPPLSPNVHSQSEDFQTVDWDGEVRCDEDVQVGGFNVGNLTVKVSGICSPSQSILNSIYLGFHCACTISTQSHYIASFRTSTCTPYSLGHRSLG